EAVAALHSSTMPTSASSPSVSAAGPGCRIRGDLISRRKPGRTAGVSQKPGRRATLAGAEFFPHPQAAPNAGAPPRPFPAAAGASGEDAEAACRRDQLRDPADAADHRVVPFLEIDARPPLAPFTRGTHLFEPRLKIGAQLLGLFARADERAERADHGENAGEV